MSVFMYLESCPALKGKARDFGRDYLRMAVVEVDPAALPEGRTRPTMISSRARGVVRIVAETVAHVGRTDRSYGYRTRAELRAMACDLNGSN